MNTNFRNIILLIAVILCGLVACTQNQEKQKSEIILKVASFNTGHFNQGKLGGFQGENVADTLGIWRDWIASQQCDIFFIQEWNVYFDKDSVYLAQTELLDPFYQNVLLGDCNLWIHNGICTNLPVSNKRIKNFSGDYYAVTVDVEIGGKQIALISVHLNWNKDYHMLDLTQFIEYLKEFDYFIAGGDMNASQAGQLLFVEAGFNVANGGDYGFICTYPKNVIREGANCCIDNIITSSNIDLRHPYSVMTNVNDQDHLPILAEVVIR